MDQKYWLNGLKIARINTVARITRCSQIMGRTDKDELSAAQIFYPCMQAADIWNLKADIAQLGMDQRKVNVLARESFPKLGLKKPIAIHHHMLMGLTEPKTEGLEGAEAAIAKKMSKSNPDSAIFMTDTTEEINKKFKKAYCPEGIVEDNPVLEYCKYIIFEKIKDGTLKEFKVERPEKFGGNVIYKDYSELEKDFIEKKLHPMDLKSASAKYIDELLEPVRKHFQIDEKAKELLTKVESYIITK
jgi:tyrosyl-tRNA synthetase